MPNPFLDDIATDPRRTGLSVPGLNDRALGTLVEVFESVVASPIPRLQEPAPKAQLVLSVEPGYGKSHLIGRLFERLRGQATLVYLRPFVKAETCWSSLLRRTVQELNYPDSSTSLNGEASPEYSQLDALACGVLAHLVANLIQRGKLKAQDPAGSMTYLRSQPLDAFGLGAQQHGWADWLRVVIPQSYVAMAPDLVRLGLNPRECLPWLKALFTFVMMRDNQDLRNACMDWISAVPIDEDVRVRIGLTSGDVAQEEEDADLSQRRLAALGALAGYFRPFVLCFDQTDAYADNPRLAKQFSNVIEFLNAEMPQQITVVTANRAPWENGIRVHFQDAQIGRLRDTPISLEGINKLQARTLINMRLDACGAVDLPNAKRLDESWMAELFQGRSEMATRTLLRETSRRWEDETVQPDHAIGQSLADRYQAAVQELLDTSNGLARFNAETLWWLVREAAHRQGGVQASTHDDHSYFTVRWQWDDQVQLFGFEGGANAKRWGAIADRAWSFQNQNLGIRTVVLRTPELPPIPAPTWAAVRQKIDAARGKCMDIYVLSPEETAQVYAARTLVDEAVAGDIPFSKREALEYVRGRLKTLWEKLKRVGDSTPAAPRHKPRVSSESSAKPATPAQAPAALAVEPQLNSVELGERLEQVYARMELKVRVTECVEAPQLIRYVLEPSEGVRAVSLASRIREVQVALGLHETPWIEAAPSHVTIDIARAKPLPISWRELSERGQSPGDSPLVFPVGVGLDHVPVRADMAQASMSHILVGGKSEFLKMVVASLALRSEPSAVQFAIIDPKNVTFAGIAGSPYLNHPVLCSLDEALIVLRRAIKEIEARALQLQGEGHASLKQRFESGRRDVPYHVVVIDEFADLVLSGRAEKKEFDTALARIAAKGRTVGVHLLLATQRPDRSIVTTLVNANVPLKICFKVSKETNSRILLGETGGESLLGRGDLICDLGKGPVRCQAPLVPSEEFVEVMMGNAAVQGLP